MSSAQISEQEIKASSAPASRNVLPEPETPKGSGFRKWIVILVVLLAVGAAVWKIRKNSEEQMTQGQKMAASADRPVPVQISQVQQKTMPIYLTELGTVTAYYTVTIKSRVDGQLNQVAVREGQKVRKGQLLAEIDPAPYQAALAQAQGQLVKDQANAANAQAEAARYTALYQAGVVSKESQQAQVSTSGQAQGSIEADKAAIEAARVNLAYTKITSPIDGVVGLRQVDPGNIVHASDTNGLLVVTQLQPISVIFTLPEDHLPEVMDLMREGKKLQVEAYDRSGATHLASGSVLTVDNQIDTTTGTVKVKAVFDNKDGALFPNQFVNVRLILEQRPNAIVVPAAAIQSGSMGNFVYLMKPGDAPADLQNSAGAPVASSSSNSGNAPRRHGKNGSAGANSEVQNQPHYYVVAQPVKVDLTEGSQVILESGAKPGDPVVVDGQEKLKNGSRVIPRQARNPNGPKGAQAHGGETTNATPAPDSAGQQGHRGNAGGQQQ